MSSTMINSIAKSIAKISSPSGVSNFANVNSEDMTIGQWIIFLITFLVLLFIMMFLGSIVFNMTIPKIIPSIRKVSTSEFFGLYVILHILFC
jgi:hypothetical protein